MQDTEITEFKSRARGVLRGASSALPTDLFAIDNTNIVILKGEER